MCSVDVPTPGIVLHLPPTTHNNNCGDTSCPSSLPLNPFTPAQHTCGALFIVQTSKIFVLWYTSVEYNFATVKGSISRASVLGLGLLVRRRSDQHSS